MHSWNLHSDGIFIILAAPMYTVYLLNPSLDDRSYEHFMIFATHLKVLLSPSGFTNALDCVKANRIHLWQRCEGKHLQTISDEDIFQTIEQTGEGEWLQLLTASVSLADSNCRMRNQHFTQTRPNHGHLNGFECLLSRQKKTHGLLPGLLQSHPNFRCLHCQMACPKQPPLEKVTHCSLLDTD